MKLQQGDYVENLTEEQFYELMELQPEPYLRYGYTTETKTLMLCNGFIGMIEYRYIHTNKLSFTEFKQRAINTFER